MTGSKPGAGEEFQLNKADILKRTILRAIRLTDKQGRHSADT